MLVTCNNKNELWCPYGTKRCTCDMYEEHQLRENEDMDFTCTDLHDDTQDCRLIRIPENEKELKVKKFIDVILAGESLAEAVKEIDFENMTLSEFLNELARKEYSDVNMEVCKRIMKK